MTRDLEKISNVLYGVFVLFSLIALGLAINQVFKLDLFGFSPLDTAYLYYLLGLYLSVGFLIFPMTNKSPKDRIPWYDYILFVLTVIVCFYFADNAENIPLLGWSLNAPELPTAFSIVLWLLVLESLRRTSGNVITVICLVFSLYPLYADLLPGILQGMDYDFLTTARSHAMSLNSILGVPMMTVGTLLVGFMVFGVVLNDTGGGEFFHDLAQSLLGRFRGGAAKVAIVGSALFGSLSGSAISNVVTIGTITIPAMKKIGYNNEYSAAIESCAATGGTIMPPIMGAAAFIMASFMGVSYAEIVIAAAIPSILYYFGLFAQVDAHAAKINLKGLPPEEIPPLGKTLLSGWPFILVLATLFYCLLILKIETWAPFYASAVLLVIALFRRDKNKLTVKKFFRIATNSSKTLIELCSILAGVGLIIGALSVTGVALAFSRELVVLVHGNLFLLLVAGALTSFILGMGMTSTACYIFLAIVMVPALTAMGIAPMAAHFYVLYWGIVSFITPPVALAAFAAAKIAGADSMKTGWKAMQLGIVTYFIPFLFVYDIHLLAQGTGAQIAYSVFRTAIAVLLIAGALEGYLIWVEVRLNLFFRALLVIASVMMALPFTLADMIGFAMTIGIIAFLTLNKRKEKKEAGAEIAP